MAAIAVTLVFTGVFVGGCLVSLWWIKRRKRYTKVAHALDEDELAFKSALESLGGDMEDFGHFEDTHEMLELDDMHLEQLKLLEEEITQNLASPSASLGDEVHGGGFGTDSDDELPHRRGEGEPLSPLTAGTLSVAPRAQDDDPDGF